jgi:hypothetical protein
MKEDIVQKATYILMIAILAVMLFNSFQMGTGGVSAAGAPTGAVVSDVIPTGIPEIYGKELGISYDGVSPNNPRLADQTIDVMSNLDRTITLTGVNLQRYVDTVSQISCEYCCGVPSIIVREEDVEAQNSRIQAAIQSGEITAEEAQQYTRTAGDSACGCAHSFAMRGIAKYLLTEHGNEFTNDEILTELAKWKTLYFPGQMTAKAQVLKEKGIKFSYINLGSNEYRGIEQGKAGSGMVGGC